MKTVNSIPKTKLSRAAQLVTTGAKIGKNYLNYYKDKITKSEEDARGKLNEANAEDIYDGLSNLKGSALKVAQMLSMEKNILPQQFTDKFSLAQFSVPPLSAPLVNKTFKSYFGKLPSEIYDEFDAQSVNAASIGQVHKAKKDGKILAVKIQYPGVADSISSDLALVKPIAMRMFNLQGKDSDKYFKEVENKLLEETNYLLEIKQSMEVSEQCEHIKHLRFPKYYPELSSDRIITMDWMQGKHLSEFAKENKDSALANKVGQTLWSFYMYQIHVLRKVHADPHPGNFLVSEQGDLIALDFGCMKQIPEDFYTPYFELIQPQNINNPSVFKEKMFELEILRASDSQEEMAFFSKLFHEMISLFSKPFTQDTFDFSNEDFFNEMYELGEKYGKSREMKKFNVNRGSEHFIYMNRTFFGLYSLLHDIKASNINIKEYYPNDFVI